jgi:predicted Zn finger-like uncharacterized protein
MILVCTKCKASYLVPATVFASGARQVRCARCAHTWQADLPSKIVVMPQEMSEAFGGVSTPPVQKPVAPVQRPPLPEQSVPSDPAVPPGVSNDPGAANLPTIWRNPHWRRLRLAVFLILALVAAGAIVWAFDQEKFASWMSHFDKVLESPDQKTPSMGAGLNLENIRSERRFEAGGMQLVVEGEVRNTSTSTQNVPDMQAKALGPDRAVIQSWRIEAPVATLPAGASVPFHSSIVAPQGTVMEVNLSFVEPPHD